MAPIPDPNGANSSRPSASSTATSGATPGSIPNYGERHRAGETISSAIAESTVNHVIAKRMVKKQQMRWSVVWVNPGYQRWKTSARSSLMTVVRLGRVAGLDAERLEPFGPHALRHTFGTQLVRGGADLVTVAELMGHARLDTTRIYTLPTKADREHALEALLTDR